MRPPQLFLHVPPNSDVVVQALLNEQMRVAGAVSACRRNRPPCSRNGRDDKLRERGKRSRELR
jgi:hypothetical protein